MNLSGPYLSPSSSLPPVRSLHCLTEKQLSLALQNLHLIYCPLRLPPTLQSHKRIKQLCSEPPTPADSGYASNAEEDEDANDDPTDHLALLRADEFEKNFTVRWLTSLIARSEELPFESEADKIRIIDDAASILASFSETTADEEDPGIIRTFSFPAPLVQKAIQVQLNDAPLSGTDHTDVGLQSWGASIVLSDMMCSSPDKFGLMDTSFGSFVELGAGTGLISLTLGKLLPHLGVSDPLIVATDYHPDVLRNLSGNIESNFGVADPPPLRTCLLDWSKPSREAPLDVPARVLIAADVIYAPEHAVWLRDCAAQLLAPDGVFWLVATIRNSGRFEGLVKTVESAFVDDESCEVSGRSLKILERETLEKRRGIGRGDESGYVLYRIGWA